MITWTSDILPKKKVGKGLFGNFFKLSVKFPIFQALLMQRVLSNENTFTIVPFSLQFPSASTYASFQIGNKINCPIPPQPPKTQMIAVLF